MNDGPVEYQIRECLGVLCRFRFPLPLDDRRGDVCPRCGMETMAVAQLIMTREKIFESAGISDRDFPESEPHLEALLDNLRSIHNVGSIFRTADAVGIRHLHLCGITPTPKQARLAKAALGAQRYVAWSDHPNSVEAAMSLQRLGYRLWAIENSGASHPLTERPVLLPRAPVLLIFGNEKIGVDPTLLALCHRIYHLPMSGSKRSLNVAVAFGIAAYQVRYGQGAS